MYFNIYILLYLKKFVRVQVIIISLFRKDWACGFWELLWDRLTNSSIFKKTLSL